MHLRHELLMDLFLQSHETFVAVCFWDPVLPLPLRNEPA